MLPIEKRRQYEKAKYLSPRSELLHDLMRYAIEHGIGRGDRFWPITRQHAHAFGRFVEGDQGAFSGAELRPSPT